MTWKSLSTIAIPAIALALGASGDARANMVMNGNFDTVNPFVSPNNQMDFSSNTGVSNVTDWSGGYSTNSGGLPVYTFVDEAGSTGGAAVNNNSSNLINDSSFNGTSLYVSGLVNYPAGNFVIQDGNSTGPPPFQSDSIAQYPISQTINGLTAGASYTVSFYQAGAPAEFGTATAETSWWQVSLGSQTQSSATMTFNGPGADGGPTASGWELQTLTFTATASSEVLSFLAMGTPAGGPPFALLDGVDMEPTPEPSTLSLTVMGLLSLGVIGLRRRRARITVV